jgi:hypothetical protein
MLLNSRSALKTWRILASQVEWVLAGQDKATGGARQRVLILNCIILRLTMVLKAAYLECYAPEIGTARFAAN